MIGLPYRAPTQTTAPVANTTSGLWTFAATTGNRKGGAKAIYLGNTSGQTIYVAFNGTTASATVYDLAPIANNGTITINAEDYGMEKIDTVSIWFPTSATVANLVIRGT